MSAATTTRRLGWSLALLAFAQLIFSLDINIVYVALPDIGASLGFDGQTQQWVVSAYTVFAGGFLLFGGRAADLLGRRRIFITALAIYAVSSLVGGLATEPILLVGARAVQGIGGALLLPSTLALIGNLFAEGPARNRALAVWGGAGASGLTLGALLGGVLTQAFGWPAVFYVNVLLAGVAAIAAFVLIPKDEPRTERRKFDFPGALTVTVAATLFVYALVQGPSDGWGAPTIVAALVIAVLSAIAFVIIETRSADPLMPPKLLGNRNVAVGVLVTFIYMGTFGALPYFLTRRAHLVAHRICYRTSGHSRFGPWLFGGGVLRGYCPGSDHLRVRPGHRMDRDVDRGRNRCLTGATGGLQRAGVHSLEYRKRDRIGGPGCDFSGIGRPHRRRCRR
jgi:MFS family permease